MTDTERRKLRERMGLDKSATARKIIVAKVSPLSVKIKCASSYIGGPLIPIPIPI